jgi:hypothetical protein
MNELEKESSFNGAVTIHSVETVTLNYIRFLAAPNDIKQTFFSLISNTANSITNYHRYESLASIFLNNNSPFKIKTYFQAPPKKKQPKRKI